MMRSRKTDKYYSANYAYTDSNFLISNLRDNRIADERLFSVLCVLENILQRGNPTKMSPELEKTLCRNSEEQYLTLFSDAVPELSDVIKGYDEYNLFPAVEFYEEIVPACFPEYPFLQQIMIPEVLINEIVAVENNNYVDQTVDFFLPPLKLVIEIDGSQHNDYRQKNLDVDRDKYLAKNGIQVCRLSTSELKDHHKITEKINSYFQGYEEQLMKMTSSYDRCRNLNSADFGMLQCTAAIRLQLTLIELCKNGTLDFSGHRWDLAVIGCEVGEYEEPAIQDFLRWMQCLCALADVSFTKPEMVVCSAGESESDEKPVTIKLSLFDRPTSFNTRGNFDAYVYSAWRQDVNYYKVSTAKKIEYKFEDVDIVGECGISKRLALSKILQGIYGERFNQFRPGQERIIMNALQLKDTIGLLPTGSGKSLCYQLSVMLQPCVSFVVCPIKALMIDQKQNLDHIGIVRTAFISSDLSSEERSTTQKQFAKKQYWWVFISPERFQSQEFRDYFTNLSVEYEVELGYAVIDEVHCMSD